MYFLSPNLVEFQRSSCPLLFNSAWSHAPITVSLSYIESRTLDASELQTVLQQQRVPHSPRSRHALRQSPPRPSGTDFPHHLFSMSRRYSTNLRKFERFLFRKNWAKENSTVSGFRGISTRVPKQKETVWPQKNSKKLVLKICIVVILFQHFLRIFRKYCQKITQRRPQMQKSSELAHKIRILVIFPKFLEDFGKFSQQKT
jgi:hypothetical protein